MKRCKICRHKMVLLELNGYANWFCTKDIFFHPHYGATQEELDEWLELLPKIVTTT